MMAIAISITEDIVMDALRNFLLGILPAGVEVVAAQGNRVPECRGVDFVTMNLVGQSRLATNLSDMTDVLFTGSIADAVLTVSSVEFGILKIGSPIYAPLVPVGTYISGFLSGSGGAGTYTISPALSLVLTDALGNPLTDGAGNVLTETSLQAGPVAAGSQEITQPNKVSIQLDVHGPASTDNMQIIVTLFRDDYAAQAFAASGYDIAPLFVTEPHQAAFINGEQQYETRWAMDVNLQVNPVLSIPQQYADAATVVLVNVDAAYPPA